MKRKGLTLILIILMTLILSACSNSKSMKADTPDNTLLLLSMAISGNDYDSFKALLSDEQKNEISKNDFSEFNTITSAGFDNNIYGVITYSNGEMYLVNLSPKKINGEYKVQSLIKVPEEMKKLFQDK